MKRFFMILIVALTLCGVGFLGYLIFQSKNIETVSIEGTIQTLYVAGDDLNFEDAQLKVTYKNGNIKMVDLDSAKVDVSMFSADTVKHGTMIINYKSFKFEVEYDVIDKEGWFLSSNTSVITGGDPITTVYDEDGAAGTIEPTKYIYLESDGALQYYRKIDGKWYMNDGRVDKSYKYSISGDTMTVDLDGDIYELKADYNSKGYMNLSSTKLTRDSSDPDLVTKKEILKFSTSSKLKSLKFRPALSVSIDDDACFEYADVSTETFGGNEYTVVKFKRGETLETASNRSSNAMDLYMKVTYIDDFMGTVYVNVCDEMIGKFPLVTATITNEYYGQWFDFNYESKNCVIYYMVIS